MFKKIGALLVTLLGLALLVYSATRSYNFIAMTLPADRQVLAYFGLAALDGGLIAWLLAYLYGSRGGWQRGIALLMVIVDLLGAVAMFTADTLLEAGNAGVTSKFAPEAMTSFILILSAIIAVNIAATVAHHLTDPDRLKDQADEEARGKIEDAAREQVSREASSLATELAPIMAENWINETRSQYMNLLKKGAPANSETVNGEFTDVSLGHPRKQRPVVFGPARKRAGAQQQYQASVQDDTGSEVLPPLS